MFVDFTFKLSINENYLSFLSFFWINHWYITFFISFLLIFLCSYIYNGKYVYIQPAAIFLFIVFYFFEIQTNFMSFFNLSLFDINSNENNFFLNNNLNKYHPSFLYLSFFFFFITYLSYFVIKTITPFYNLINSMEIIKKNSTIVSIIFNTIALLMGSWWAVQEGSWGGWWNWDSSETLGLTVSLFLLLYFHYCKEKHNFLLSFFFFFAIILYLFLISYYLVQLSFDLTSHNFGIKFFFFFNNNLLILELLNFFFFSIFIFFSSFYFFFTVFLNLPPYCINFNLRTAIKIKKQGSFFFTFIFLCMYVGIFITSFADLFNFFLFKTLGINFLNKNFSPIFFLYTYLNFFLFFFFFFEFFSSFLFLYNKFFLLPFFIFNNFSTVVHFFIFLFFNLTFLISNLNFVYFYVENIFKEFFIETNVVSLFTNFTIINNLFVENLNIYFINIDQILNSFWKISIDISKNNNFFSLLSSTSSFLNLFSVNNDFINFLLVVQNQYSLFILFFFFFFFFLIK